ncbi:uncharacterized protein LOC117642925 [Thrips palmi]|uniref:Uncharacterized protein LOC117642925 n=1 Tax=Thrips palmi TaxID=161013 RepID=A0A6P8YTQ6_THRPL|nr:uncharacterized protein LOC117642925 [Thrips palmi]
MSLMPRAPSVKWPPDRLDDAHFAEDITWEEVLVPDSSEPQTVPKMLDATMDDSLASKDGTTSTDSGVPPELVVMDTSDTGDLKDSGNEGPPEKLFSSTLESPTDPSLPLGQDGGVFFSQRAPETVGGGESDDDDDESDEEPVEQVIVKAPKRRTQEKGRGPGDQSVKTVPEAKKSRRSKDTETTSPPIPKGGQSKSSTPAASPGAGEEESPKVAASDQDKSAVRKFGRGQETSRAGLGRAKGLGPESLGSANFFKRGILSG